MNWNIFQWHSHKIGIAVPRLPEPTVAPSHFAGKLLTGILALNLVAVMLVALNLYESRQNREKQAVVTVQNLSRLLEQDLAASFDKINLTLLTVVDEVDRLGSSGSLDASALNAFIARQAARLPELTDLRMADAQGDLRYGTGLQPNTLINIADREHFVRQHDRPDAGLVVGMPTVSRMNGKWQIVMSRRLNQPDGSFAGTVGAVIELDIITAKFATLDVGQNGIINLYDHELAMVSRYPALRNGKPPPIGQKIISREFEEQLRRTPAAGLFHAISPIDRLERTFAYRKVTSYPFYIIVGLASEDYLGEWWKDVAKNGIFMVIFALVTFAFAWLTVGAWTRREADLEVIRQQEQKFRTLLDSSPDPLVIADAKGLIAMVNLQLVALFGYEPEELVGQPVEVLLPHRYRGGHVALRQGYTQAPQVREVGKDRLLWAVTKDGREVPVSISLSPIQTGQGLMVAASIRDTSERRANEAKIKRLTDLYAALVQCSQAIVRCASEDELFLQVCRAAVEFGGMKIAWVGLLDEANQLVKPVAWYGTDTEYLEGIQISVKADEPSGRGGAGTAIRENRSVWIQDFQNDPRLAPWRERGARAGWRAAAALPLLRQGKAIGVLILYAGEVNAFDEAARNLLLEMARDVGHALDHYRLQAERKQAVEALRESEKRFRCLTEMTSDIYWETDVEHRLTQIAHSITGLPEQLSRPSPLIGARRWERPFLSPDEAGWQAHRALLDAHLPFRNFEIARLNPSGAIYYVTINGDPVFDAAGHFKGYQGVGTDITERGQQEEKIRQLLKENATILSNALVGIAYIRQRRIVSCNRRFEDIFQYKPGELIGEGTGRLYDSRETFEHIGASAYSEAAKDHGYTGEVRLRHKDGSLFWGTLNGKAVDPAHPHEGSIWIYADITKRKQDEEQLRIAATAFDSQEGMMITDADSVILRVNRAFTETTGYTAEEAVGQTPRLLSSGRHDKAFYAQMWATIQRTGSWKGEIWGRRKNGEIYPKWLTITAVKAEDGAVTHYIGTHTDITARKATEDQLHNLAFYDPLTQLPNRRLLLDRLDHALASSARSTSMGALLFLDLDNFKTLNDTRGHDVGDQLLIEVAHRLQTSVRQSDTVARLGGDEFVVLLEGLDMGGMAAPQAEAVALKIQKTLNQPFRLEHLAGKSEKNVIEFHCTASMGVTLLGDDQTSIEELMQQADLAMYQSKTAGRNTLRFFDPQMQAIVTDRAALEADLREALKQQQFILHYQPQGRDDGLLTGAEALVRWQHPQRGMVSPAEFIPLAEETNLILPLGQWVLETACAQLATWAGQPNMAHLSLAVNISAKQLQKADFVDQVLAVLGKTGANPEKLKLELTESLLVSNVETTIAKMSALKAHGVGFALDDFGTGYSSLSYLKRLPLDQLKIDQGFVRDILIDPNDAAIAKMVIVLAGSLGLTVMAEGVETEEQKEFLASQGCHAYQGYLFSRPLPLDAFEAFAGRV